MIHTSTILALVLVVSNEIRLATGAFSPSVYIYPYPTSSLSFGHSSWTAQFYFMVFHAWPDPREVFQEILDFTGPQGTVSLAFRGLYLLTPMHANKLEIFFLHKTAFTVSSPYL